MSSGPVGVDAKLKFEVDFTGGDRTKARSLMASLAVTLKELHEDYTAFHTADRFQVFDLDKTSHGAYRQCAFVGDGVQAQANKDGYHGTLSDQTGDLGDATGKTRPLFTQGSWGALTSARCTVDDDGRDAKNVACSDFGFRDVQLALVNKEDLDADKWTAPEESSEAGKSTKRSGQRDERSKALHKALATEHPTKDRAGSCAAGTDKVAVGHQTMCAPKLKH